MTKRPITAALAIVALSPALIFGQQSRYELTHATTPADDSKPNSSSVPDVYAINGKFDRVVVLRFKYQADLLEGLERMIKEQKIRNAVILSGIGSVRNYHIHSVSNRDFPSKDVYVKDPTAPADVVSMNGYVVNGQVHAHMTLANANGAFGGHIEPGTNVFTFVIVTLGVLDMDLTKVDDKTYR